MLLTAEIPVADYTARYRDTETFGAACRACPGYGRTWSCPPFAPATEYAALDYDMALIVAFTFETDENDVVSAAATLLRRNTDLLIDIERRTGGRAFGFCGMCRLCAACFRPQGKPCPHADLVRPPLEAFGFDLCRTASELLNTTLQWTADSQGRRHLTFIGAVFHNLPSAKNLIGMQSVSLIVGANTHDVKN